MLDVKNLKMYYEILRGQVKAVDDISFGMKKGDSLGLAGESGCGKTSAALSILRLLPRNAKIIDGTINFEDTDLTKMKTKDYNNDIRWKKISVIFQGAMNALHPTRRIGDQIAEGVLIHEKISKKEALDRTGKLLELVGIEASKANRYPHELSGGMKQRTMIAMSLVCNPDLVIADEPTTALDVIIQAQVLKLIKDLQDKLNLSMMLISHDLSMIADTCDKIVIMYAGKIAEQGDITAIFKEPLHPYTKKLIMAFPSIRGKKRELATISGFPPDLLNPPLGCRFHPRCSYAMEICKKKEPPTTEAHQDHFVACHLIG